jgi:hypothetical protein
LNRREGTVEGKVTMIMSCLVLSGPKHTWFFAGREKRWSGSFSQNRSSSAVHNNLQPLTNQRHHMIKGVTYRTTNLTEWNESHGPAGFQPPAHGAYPEEENLFDQVITAKSS